MAEYVDKTELWKKMTQRYDEVTDILEVIDGMPTIDIVHCSECEHRDNDGFCPYEKACPPDHWFCGNGERKE